RPSAARSRRRPPAARSAARGSSARSGEQSVAQGRHPLEIGAGRGLAAEALAVELGHERAQQRFGRAAGLAALEQLAVRERLAVLEVALLAETDDERGELEPQREHVLAARVRRARALAQVGDAPRARDDRIDAAPTRVALDAAAAQRAHDPDDDECDER